jgi:hypothetical protein
MNRLFVLVGAVVVAFSPGVANGATALLVGGKGNYAELSDEEMATAFGGYFADYTRVNVPFPGLPDQFGYSIEVGADNLYEAVYSTPGPKTIGGVSEGAPTIDEVLRRLMNDINNPTPGKTPPSPSELNAMVYGYPNRLSFIFGGVEYQPFPVTPYAVVVVSAEYDGIADFPDNWFNLLAVVNAVMGAEQLHVAAAFTDVANVPTRYSIVTNSLGGTTTTILIPTPLLPLLTPLAGWGFAPEFVAFMDSLLRPIIDSAYNRPTMQLGIPPTLATHDLSVPEVTTSVIPVAENRASIETQQPSPSAGPEPTFAPERPASPTPAAITDQAEGAKDAENEIDTDSATLEPTIDDAEGTGEHGEEALESDEPENDPTTGADVESPEDGATDDGPAAGEPSDNDSNADNADNADAE